MKRNSIVIILLALGLVTACKKSFLITNPIGTAGLGDLTTPAGLNTLVVSAYRMVSAVNNNGSSYGSAADEWVWGSVAADDAYKGSEINDQPPINDIEKWVVKPQNGYLNDRWSTLFDGIARANLVLKTLPAVKGISDSAKTEIKAEMRFLRGHYYFMARKIFNKYVPYVDETMATYFVKNNQEIWPFIEADFTFAAQNLPVSQGLFMGKATKYAAIAYLGKTLLYEKQYAKAKVQFDLVVNSGLYSLNSCFHDNFDGTTKNGPESIFAAQNSVNDGASGGNGNQGDVLNFSYGPTAPVSCCGFFQPSQNLVNAFQVTVSGLPVSTAAITDAYTQGLKNDLGILSSQPFTPDNRPVDPRLDWTVGRRGLPFLDWGIDPGASWVRNQSAGGPYLTMKTMYKSSQKGVVSDASSNQNSSINISIIRYADLLLMDAECEIEAGSLEIARHYVNMVRERAAKPACAVMNSAGKPAANYLVLDYTSPWTDQVAARNAVQTERRLELAEEGHRFFDLVRWGLAKQVLNNYAQTEYKIPEIGNAVFTDAYQYFPVPQTQIDQSKGTLQQNPSF